MSQTSVEQSAVGSTCSIVGCADTAEGSSDLAVLELATPIVHVMSTPAAKEPTKASIRPASDFSFFSAFFTTSSFDLAGQLEQWLGHGSFAVKI
jgi:hypothetical protein